MNDLRVVFIDTLPLYENRFPGDDYPGCESGLLLAVAGAVSAIAMTEHFRRRAHALHWHGYNFVCWWCLG
jgi:hypothetical protein